MVSKADVIKLGLNGMDFSKRQCDPSTSGMRIAYVSKDSIDHRFFTLDELDALDDGPILFEKVKAGLAKRKASFHNY